MTERSRKEVGKATGLGPEGQQGYAPVMAPEPGCARLCVSPHQCMHVINPGEKTHKLTLSFGFFRLEK